MRLLMSLLLTPAVGAGVIAFLPSDAARLIRGLALVTTGATLVLACALLVAFDPALPGPQFLELHRWNPRLGTSFPLAVDGFSLPMVVLASLLSLIALLASNAIRERVKGYYLLMLVLFDFIPGHSFAMSDMKAGARELSPHAQILIFLGFLIGFGVKMPILPIHGWLPLAHVEAPSPVSILLSGILLKMGAYGLIRVSGMLPDAVLALQGILATMALISLLYGGLLAWRQSDLKAMIAYSSVSHMGVVLLGIAALNFAGLSGAVMQMTAHGLVAGALFLLIGLLYERTHTRDVNRYSSLVRVTPRFAFFKTLAFVAAVGLPGTVGFIAELNTLIGGFERWGWVVVLLSLGIMVSAAYAIRTVGRLFTGPVRAEMRAVSDLRGGELVAAGVLTAGIILLGVFPAQCLELTAASIAAFSTAFTGSV